MAEYKDLHGEIKGVSANGTSYQFPFRRGNHASFAKLNSDKELRPAEDIELSYVFEGAFRAESEGWRMVRDEVVLLECIGNPKRMVYLPKRIIKSPFTPSFEGGVVVQRDLNGIGNSKPLDYNIEDGWEEKEGIYVNSSAELIFVPSSKYKAGEHTAKSFIKDGLVKALTGGEESAEVLARTAKDNKRKPWLWAFSCIEIQKEEQRVSSFSAEFHNRLDICAGNGGPNGYGFVVGVFR